MPKLWGGRFSQQSNTQLESFTASHQIDRRLYKEDIKLNIAYAKALHRARILTELELQEIEQGLLTLEKEITDGQLQFFDKLEDIHSHIEHWLTEKIGDPARKIHSGKSRNDQVITSLRLYLKNILPQLVSLIDETILVISNNLCKEDRPIPGYTHLQKAQPVTLSLHFGAYISMLNRDIDRINDAIKRIDIMPLGAGALAGNPFIDDNNRKRIAKDLGFACVAKNHMDVVSDRDFVAEIIFIFSLIMVHLSRFCEEIILWSSAEFDYLTIGDNFTTGSSIMPQKKNPDIAELIRGKTGSVFGGLQAMLVNLKALPLTYNRDLQEDKIYLFNTLDTVFSSLSILKEMIPSIEFNYDRLRQNATSNFSLATRVAEYLVNKGLPFRKAHSVVGNIVNYCAENNKNDFVDLKIEEFSTFSDLFEKDIFDALII